jgi:hypothetical protein
MLPKPETACFVIADISGYTGFLAGIELDHAQDIIADVMDTVLSSSATMASSSSTGWPAARKSPVAMSSSFIGC